MNRRDLLKMSATAAAVPAALEAQHVHGAGTAAAQAAAAPAAWTPQFFDDHQNQTVIALADLILPATDTPGAKAALVNRHLDKILAAATEQDQEKFREGLGWLDGYAIRLHKKPFTRLTPAQQTAILTTLSVPGSGDRKTGERFFRDAKSIIARVYYATEIGFNELNKGGRVPKSFACEHPEKHA